MSNDVHPIFRPILDNISREDAITAARLNAETITAQQEAWRKETNRLHEIVRELQGTIREVSTQRSELERQLANTRTERDHNARLLVTLTELLDTQVVEVVLPHRHGTKLITLDGVLEDSATYCRDLCSCGRPECSGPDEHDLTGPTCGGGRS